MNKVDSCALAPTLPTTKSVLPIFATIRQSFEDANVVIYNAGNLSQPSDPTNLLTISPASIESDMYLMNTITFIAAREAQLVLRGWMKVYVRHIFTLETGSTPQQCHQANTYINTLVMGKSTAST